MWSQFIYYCCQDWVLNNQGSKNVQSTVLYYRSLATFCSILPILSLRTYVYWIKKKVQKEIIKEFIEGILIQKGFKTFVNPNITIAKIFAQYFTVYSFQFLNPLSVSGRLCFSNNIFKNVPVKQYFYLLALNVPNKFWISIWYAVCQRKLTESGGDDL